MHESLKDHHPNVYFIAHSLNLLFPFVNDRSRRCLNGPLLCLQSEKCNDECKYLWGMMSALWRLGFLVFGTGEQKIILTRKNIEMIFIISQRLVTQFIFFSTRIRVFTLFVRHGTKFTRKKNQESWEIYWRWSLNFWDVSGWKWSFVMERHQDELYS